MGGAAPEKEVDPDSAVVDALWTLENGCPDPETQALIEARNRLNQYRGVFASTGVDCTTLDALEAVINRRSHGAVEDLNRRVGAGDIMIIIPGSDNPVPVEGFSLGHDGSILPVAEGQAREEYTLTHSDFHKEADDE